MAKTVIVTLTVTIPDSALSADAVVTVAGINYAGKVTGIVTHEDTSVPQTTTVTLKGTGLSVSAPTTVANP